MPIFSAIFVGWLIFVKPERFLNWIEREICVYLSKSERNCPFFKPTIDELLTRRGYWF